MAAKFDDSGDSLSENHEINVTPFIDVMLVLLIIFMVAAPLATVDIPVDLPVASAKQQPRPDKPIFLTIKPDLSLNVGNDPISRQGLSQALDAAAKSDREQRIFLRADKVVPFGEVMKVMNILKATGYLKVALVGLEDHETPSNASPSSAAVAPSPDHSPITHPTVSQ